MESPPLVSFIGRPDCGKTTLLERLLPVLTSRGYKIGTIKHHVHEFSMDTPGKDTWRHKQAGAHTVALSSPTGIGLVLDCERDHNLDELISRFFMGMDLVIAEGYKRGLQPKIEVYRAEIHPEPLPGRDETWLALVGDFPPGTGNAAGPLPLFKADNVAGIADFLESKLIQPARAKPEPNLRISLRVNGVPLPLNRFATGFISGAVKGMLASLRGCEEPADIELIISETKPAKKRKGEAPDA